MGAAGDMFCDMWKTKSASFCLQLPGEHFRMQYSDLAHKNWETMSHK